MSVLRDIERAIGEGVKFLCVPRYWPGGIGNGISTWVPSINDVLADDWSVLED